MKKNVFLALAIVMALACSGVSKRTMGIHMVQEPTSLEEVKGYAQGEWQSLTVELRPTEDRAGKGKIQSTYLKRSFKYLKGDRFEGTITMFADQYGKAPLMKFEFKGDLKWGNRHPIAEGAYEIDYVLNEGFALTPLHPKAAAMLNSIPVKGLPKFKAGQTQDILRKPFPLFKIAKGQIVTDYDLIYFRNGMLFMGAKHVDGTPFDKPSRRPHQLQIPLRRVYKS